MMVMKSCPDLSALSGTRHSASSTAPSSPEPPDRSGCTAAHRGITFRVKKKTHNLSQQKQPFTIKGTKWQVSYPDTTLNNREMVYIEYIEKLN